jgi:hypothetical protein
LGRPWPKDGPKHHRRRSKFCNNWFQYQCQPQ